MASTKHDVAGLPLATDPDAQQIESLRPRIEGRPCLIVGSGPAGASPVVPQDGELVISVNGAISSLSPDVVADLWFVNSKLQDRIGDPRLRPLHRTMLEQATNRAVSHIIFLRGPKVASEPYTLERLQRLGCCHASWSVVDKSTKAWLETELCGRNDARSRRHGEREDPCSAGIFATTVALWCGASQVRQVGFSWTPGYQYRCNEPVTRRGHERADKRALLALVQRYGDRLHTPLLAQGKAA